jgi:hypothetical protein
MIGASLLLAAGICLAPAAPQPPPPDSVAALFRSGTTYAEFYAGVRERREQWERVTRLVAVPDDLLTRARAAGRWRLLLITVDACSDSLNSVPYLAALVAAAPNLELRVVSRDAAPWVMASHQTPDHRAATPTLLLLDSAFVERGSWVERPAELQRWYIATGQGLPIEQFRRDKQAWYDRDAGRSTLREIVEMLEAGPAR